MSKFGNRIILLACGIWALLIFGITGALHLNPNERAVYSMSSDSVNFMDYTYVSDNTYGVGNIYQIDKTGKVKKIYQTGGRNYVSGWSVLHLATDGNEGRSGGDFYAILKGGENEMGYASYRIVAYTDNLGTDTMSPAFYIHSFTKVTGFSYEEGIFYITAVTNNRQEVLLYSFNETEMIPIAGIDTNKREKLAAGATELSPLSSERNSSGQLFSDAEYANSMLYVRTDEQEVGEYFAVDEEKQRIFDTRQEGILDRLTAEGVSLVTVVAIIIVGCVILLIVGIVLEHRRRIVYRVVVVEALVAAVFIIFIAFTCLQGQDSATREFVRSERRILTAFGDGTPTDFATEEFFTSSEYDAYYSAMQTLAEDPGAVADIMDICVTEGTTGDIVLNLKGNSNLTVGYVYGETAQRIATAQDGVYSSYGKLGGEKVMFVSAPVSAAPQYRVLCVAKVLTPLEYLFRFDRLLLLLAFVTFVLVAILVARLIIYDSRVLLQVSEALEMLGLTGDTEVIPEGLPGYDTRRIWASINEISRNLKEANRFGYLTYEAYYRFAPKRIETILGKNAITEVDVGDTRRVYGTVAFIHTPTSVGLDRTSLKEKNLFLENVSKYASATDGIIVSAESDLSAVRMLFTDENHNSIRFGTDLAQEAYAESPEQRPTIILHYGDYVYGVAGTDTIAYTFLSGEDEFAIEGCAKWLGSLGVTMAITENVMEREKGAWDVRYIGFILPNSQDREHRINLYEVLDAQDQSSRIDKRRMAEDFDSALKLFYERDFYFARNAFTDILREAPTDDVAKWYLFECERLLNEQASPDFVGELHFDRN